MTFAGSRTPGDTKIHWVFVFRVLSKHIFYLVSAPKKGQYHMQYTVCCLMTSQILEASPTKFPLVEYGMRLLEQLMHDQRYILRQDVTVIVY